MHRESHKLSRMVVIVVLACCTFSTAACDNWDWQATESVLAEAVLTATGDWATDSLAAILNAMFPIADALSGS